MPKQKEEKPAKRFVPKSEAMRAQGKKPAGPPRAIKVDKQGFTKVETITVPAPVYEHMELMLIGEPDSTLITHAWSEKALREMLDKQMGTEKGKTKKAREPKDPFAEFNGSLYEHPDGGYAFPAVGFKTSAVEACKFVDGIKMATARAAFQVLGDLIQILGTPKNRLDMVRVGHGSPKGPVADIRFRGQFDEWAVVLPIKYYTRLITPADIINLFNHAGFAVGVGEWRPQKNGNRGMFHVATAEEGKAIYKRLKPADRKKITPDSSGTNKLLQKYRLLRVVNE